MNMTKKTIIIFGATGGVGSQLARDLSSAGHTVLLTGRSEEKLSALASETEKPYRLVDAADGEQVELCIAETKNEYGSVDGVVNCAGSLILKPAHLTTDAEWEKTISANLTTSFIIVRAAARHMIESGGSIVLISTSAARIGIANHEAIAAAKAGIIGLTLSAAATYGPKGIRVNCITPGLVRTPMSERITSNETSLKYSTSMHVLGRIGEPEDISQAIGWLLSDQASWVTGQVLGVDGGLSTIRTRSG